MHVITSWYKLFEVKNTWCS